VDIIHDSLVSCIGTTPIVALDRLFPQDDVEVLAKLEFLNPGGSVKDRPARYIIERGLASGEITSETTLVESTSGNMGVALAMVAKIHGIRFIAVVDPNVVQANLAIIRYLGARVEMVTEHDQNGGYLGTRIARVHELLREEPGALWINQYENSLNRDSHYYGTGEEIVSSLDRPVDCLVVAVSTTGTIMGVARRLRRAYPKMRVVAVDSIGSIIFGGPPTTRRFPGIGSSRRPGLLNFAEIDRVVHVSEEEMVKGCRDLLREEAILAGASSGSVIAGIRRLLPVLPTPVRVMTLLPDRGERYLDSVYLDAGV
jgi:cysteine synthase A